ncbi:putative C6 transcription factor [Xylaria arbuscula]|nr:putative C6 transcription factor [Xylaria arbuscula]
MTGRPLVPLQPKPNTIGEDVDPSPPPARPRKGRSAVLVACEPCRRLKAKCDGERPSCHRCRTRGQDCVYELPHDALSRSSARKEIANRLQLENSELRLLLHHLSSRPEAEAHDIYRRLRLTVDPIALMHSIKQAELLLPVGERDGDELAMLRQLDANALEESVIKVPAQPWTSVSGDGIVSELISSWFKWDDGFLYPFVDRECFLRDIHSANPQNATYCSPFLVNAICAYRSYFSETVETVRRTTKKCLKEQFLAESIKHCGSTIPTLPTIQALWIMFSISFLKGDDRNGSLYRFASYGMLRRSRLSRVFPSLSDRDSEDSLRKRTMSKMIWGLFCLESIVSTNFRGMDILQTPKIPCPYLVDMYGSTTNVDIFDRPFTATSPQPPYVSGAIGTLCRVAVLVSEILTYGQDTKDKEDTGPEQQDNITKRTEFLVRLYAIDSSLPSSLRHDQNFTPSTCFLRVVINTALYAAIRTLQSDVVLDTLNRITVDHLRLRTCELDIQLTEQYLARWSTRAFSIMTFLGPLNAGTMLLPILPDERATLLFTRVCKMMHSLSAHIPLATYVLKGWEAALWAKKLEVPRPARPYFDNLNTAREELTEVSTSLVVTHVPPDESMLTKQWDDGELGFLLQKWSDMRLE